MGWEHRAPSNELLRASGFAQIDAAGKVMQASGYDVACKAMPQDMLGVTWLARECEPDRDHVMQEEAVPRIVPRVVVEFERPQEYLDMLTGLKADVVKVLAKECKRSRLDGLVR